MAMLCCIRLAFLAAAPLMTSSSSAYARRWCMLHRLPPTLSWASIALQLVNFDPCDLNGHKLALARANRLPNCNCPSWDKLASVLQSLARLFFLGILRRALEAAPVEVAAVLRRDKSREPPEAASVGCLLRDLEAAPAGERPESGLSVRQKWHRGSGNAKRRRRSLLRWWA